MSVRLKVPDPHCPLVGARWRDDRPYATAATEALCPLMIRSVCRSPSQDPRSVAGSGDSAPDVITARLTQSLCPLGFAVLSVSISQI